MADMQKSRVANKPLPDLQLLPKLLKEEWQLEVVALKMLDSYDDANFYLRARRSTDKSTPEEKFLVKFYNATESKNPEFLKGLTKALKCLDGPPLSPIKVPQPLQRVCANDTAEHLDFINVSCRTVGGEVKDCALRVFYWIEGETLNTHAPSVNWSNFIDIGKAISRLQQSLEGFDEPALHREHLWDVRQFHHAASSLIPCVPDTQLQSAISTVYDLYQTRIPSEAFQFSSSPLLPWSVIMGDANDANLIVDPQTHQITGIIDFSDTMSTWRINEIAIALTYGLVTPFAKVPNKLVLASLFLGYLGLTVKEDASHISAVEGIHTQQHEHSHEHSHDHGSHDASNHSSGASHGCCGHHHDDRHEDHSDHDHRHGHDNKHDAATNNRDIHVHAHSHQEAYHQHKHLLRTLTALELSLLPLLIAVRLSTSVMVGAFSIAQHPENSDYLQLHAAPGRNALREWCGCKSSSTSSTSSESDGLKKDCSVKVQLDLHGRFFQRLYDVAHHDAWPVIQSDESEEQEVVEEEQEEIKREDGKDSRGADSRSDGVQSERKRMRWSWSTGTAEEQRHRLNAVIREVYGSAE